MCLELNTQNHIYPLHIPLRLFGIVPCPVSVLITCLITLLIASSCRCRLF